MRTLPPSVVEERPDDLPKFCWTRVVDTSPVVTSDSAGYVRGVSDDPAESVDNRANPNGQGSFGESSKDRQRQRHVPSPTPYKTGVLTVIVCLHCPSPEILNDSF